MSRQIQIRRGTAAEHENFIGKIGEITMDTTNNTLRVHDGQTPGGTVLAKQSEMPTGSLSVPKYETGTTYTLGETFQSDGWLKVYLKMGVAGATHDCTLQIKNQNGTILTSFNYCAQYLQVIDIMIPVKSGLKCECVGSYNELNLTFFPC